MRNKAMLKEIVDETSHGKYDFMYLRIGKLPAVSEGRATTDAAPWPDFANNCK